MNWINDRGWYYTVFKEHEHTAFRLSTALILL